jgi:hypothetical protein
MTGMKKYLSAAIIVVVVVLLASFRLDAQGWKQQMGL